MNYPGKVARIIAPHIIDAELTLGFGVTIRRRLWLQGIEEITEPMALKKAMHCLVVLIGGKKISVQIDDADHTSRTFAELYRDLDVTATQAFTDFLQDSGDLHVNAYMSWLSFKDYDVEDVKTRLIHKKGD